MHILNINSALEINNAQKVFIEKILICDNNHNICEEDSLYNLSNKIPIFLVNEFTMKHYGDITKYEFESNVDIDFDIKILNDYKNPKTEWFGFYDRENSGVFDNTPMIVICPERIANNVDSEEEFMLLVSLVIIHEFAHAKMDYNNENSKYCKKDMFWHWMEESLANKLALEILHNFFSTYHKTETFKNFTTWSQRAKDFIVNFVKQQPPAYALGYELFDKHIGWWWIWKNHKKELSGTKKLEEKKTWLTYVMYNFKKIDIKKIKPLYDSLFM